MKVKLGCGHEADIPEGHAYMIGGCPDENKLPTPEEIAKIARVQQLNK